VHGYRSTTAATAVCFHRDSHFMWQQCD
jgi:hypothetical protein